VEGTDARIRFYLGREARVELRVLNTAAEVVEEISREAPTPGMDNEIAWDASGYAAGLYVCRLEAFGSDGTREVRFVKVAIKR
jgi:hypothetical protein